MASVFNQSRNSLTAMVVFFSPNFRFLIEQEWQENYPKESGSEGPAASPEGAKRYSSKGASLFRTFGEGCAWVGRRLHDGEDHYGSTISRRIG
jgi:hypothetical protein